MSVPPCQRFLESYACGSLAQFLSQHASRLLTLLDGVVMETQLKAGIHTLDQNLQDLEICLEHIRQSQVRVLNMTARRPLYRSVLLQAANCTKRACAFFHSASQTFTILKCNLFFSENIDSLPYKPKEVWNDYVCACIYFKVLSGNILKKKFNFRMIHI